MRWENITLVAGAYVHTIDIDSAAQWTSVCVSEYLQICLCMADTEARLYLEMEPCAECMANDISNGDMHDSKCCNPDCPESRVWHGPQDNGSNATCGRFGYSSWRKLNTFI